MHTNALEWSTRASEPPRRESGNLNRENPEPKLTRGKKVGPSVKGVPNFIVCEPHSMFCSSSFIYYHVLYVVNQVNHQHDQSECCGWKCGINDPQIYYHVIGPKGWRWGPQSLKIVQQVEHTCYHVSRSHQVEFSWSNRVKLINNQQNSYNPVGKKSTGNLTRRIETTPSGGKDWRS